jgi:hypothetical protein
MYMHVIVDIPPQLITPNQRSKSNKYPKEQAFKHMDKKNSFVFFLRVGLLFLKVTLGIGFQSVKSTFVFRRKR